MPIPGDTPPLGRNNARESVYRHLRGWIEDGVLRPGETVRDRDIAALLGVSRTPVREALQMLEQAGVIETLPGRATRVVDASPDDVRAVYAPLAVLQGLAAELATPLATAADIEQLTAHNERLREALDAGDPIGARDADRAFHQVLVRRAGNPYLTAAIEPLLLHVRRLDAVYFERAGAGRESYEEHQAIIAAIAAGDAATAREWTVRNFSGRRLPAVGAEREEGPPVGAEREEGPPLSA